MLAIFVFVFSFVCYFMHLTQRKFILIYVSMFGSNREMKLQIRFYLLPYTNTPKYIAVRISNTGYCLLRKRNLHAGQTKCFSLTMLSHFLQLFPHTRFERKLFARIRQTRFHLSENEPPPQEKQNN